MYILFDNHIYICMYIYIIYVCMYYIYAYIYACIYIEYTKEWSKN